MKKKDRQRKKQDAQKRLSRTQIGHHCTLNSHEVFNHPELGTYNAYVCSRCGDCYQCAHQVIDRVESGCIKWYRCLDGFEKPSYMDVGQFKPLVKAHPEQKGIQWYKYS